MNRKDGRPPGEKIDSSLLDTLRDYPFFDIYLNGKSPNQYSEVKLREVVNTISQKIQDFIIAHPLDHEPISSLIKSKIEADKWQDYIKGNYIKDLLNAKTLKRCFIKNVASASTINILTAFEKVLKKEKLKTECLRKNAGLYFVYMVHNSMPGKFQISLLEITESGKSFYTTKNRLSVVQKRQPLETEVIGNSNLLLTLRESDFVLVLYLYLGYEEGLSFLQAVYMYSNRMSETIANLAVLEKIDKVHEQEILKEFNPERGMDLLPNDLYGSIKKVLDNPTLTVRQNIQQYLLHKAKPIVPKGYKGTRPFDFARHVAVYPGPYQQEALNYNKLKWLAGKYYIYFNERYPSASKEMCLTDTQKREYQIFLKNRFFSTVQKALLEIKPDNVSGVITCTMRTRRDDKKNELLYKGLVYNHEMHDSTYLLLSLYLQPEKDRCLNLLLNTEEDKLIGCYQINYITSKQLGAGNIFAIRASIINQQDQEPSLDKWNSEYPKTFLPHQFNPISPLEKAIVSHLSKNQQSIITPPSSLQLIHFQNTKHQGLYNMYCWREDKSVHTSLLRIYDNGYVRHFSITKEKDGSFIENHAYGQLEKLDRTLNILLRNETDQRAGFLCVKVDEEEPLAGKTCYAGTFAGMIGGQDKMPVATQFLLEFDSKAKSLSEEIEKLWSNTLNSKCKMSRSIQKALEFFNQQTPDIWLTFEGNIFTWDDLTKFSQPAAVH